LASQGYYGDLASHMEATEDNSGWLGNQNIYYLDLNELLKLY
jgi:hypothetical protein